MQSHCVTAHSLRRSPRLLNERRLNLLTYYLLTYLLTYILTFLLTYFTYSLIQHFLSFFMAIPIPGLIPGFVFHNPEIPGLEKGSGIASPSPKRTRSNRGGQQYHTTNLSQSPQICQHSESFLATMHYLAEKSKCTRMYDL